ncbi:MAG: serine--tRNA ligase [Candidatus Pacebacteria bacterium]|nr:serine--tRNA ligase [Candidatus Paceibacterota bacterium]
MFDIKFIRENKEKYLEIVKNKGVDLDVEKLLLLDKKRRDLIYKTEELKKEQNKLSREEIEKAKKIKEEFKALKEKLNSVEKEYNSLMLITPNIYSDDTPVGKDEKSNVEILKMGEIRKLDFKIKSHIELGKDLDIIDIERGVKTSGFRGYYLKNEGALLSLALMWHCILKMKEKGFSFMIPPTLLREFALVGSGHFPFGKEEIYQIANPGKLANGENVTEKTYLAGTSEPSLLAYFSDLILEEEKLPVKVCAFSNCYRSEIGSYGKDTKGLYRIHEFMKVEQVVLCKNSIEESNFWLEEMRKISEEILQELELPYRILQLCTGDMGAGKYKMYDIETWMPSRNSYGETHSDSNLTDWQSRRLNIKYRNKKGEKFFAYTLNNTVIASPRILIAILENHQEKNGSVKIPKVLTKYLPFNKIG